MIEKDFWRNSEVILLGAGSFGTVLTNIVASNCKRIRVWARKEDTARLINETKKNPEYAPSLTLPDKVEAFHDLDEVFRYSADAIIWTLPSHVSREVARDISSRIHGQEIVIHATKGIENGSLKRISEILAEEMPNQRIGVLSGPNLAKEIEMGEPAATVVASRFQEVIRAGECLFNYQGFRIYPSKDVVGVEWCGVLKNILAIASGALDGLGLGLNARAYLITLGLEEMIRFGVALGGSPETFLGLAGIGDVLATCGSRLSRNYRVGLGLSEGKLLQQVIEEIGSSTEGVATTVSVFEYSKKRGISMPVTEAVYTMVQGQKSAKEAFSFLN